MNLERTIRQLKESNTIGPNPQQLKVKDFFPKMKNKKALAYIEIFVKMSGSPHEKALKTLQDMYKMNPKKFEELMASSRG